MSDVRAYIAERNAGLAAEALREAGFDAVRRDHLTIDPEIGARHYVFVTVDGYRYSAQWHLRATHGTSFLSNRGDGWDEATAQRLSAIASASDPSGPEFDDGWR